MRRALPTSRSAGHEQRPRHRRRRLHRQPRRQGAAGAGHRRRRLRRPVGRATARPTAPRDAPSSRATSTTRRGSAPRSASIGADAVMHFAAWLDGRRVGARSGRLLPEQRRRRALGARRHGGGERAAISCFPRRAPCSAIPWRRRSRKSHPKQPINAYGETKLDDRARAAALRDGYGIRSIALRYFNAAGADPDGELGEDHRRRSTSSPARSTPRWDAIGSRSSAPTTTRRTAPAFETTSTSTTWRRRTCSRSARCAAAPRPRGTTWATAGRPRSRTSSTRWNGSSDGKSRYTWVRAGRAIRRSSSPRASASDASWVDAAVRGHRRHRETAWRWRESHPHGYARKATV